MSQVSRHQLNNRVYDKIFSLYPQFLHRMTSRGKQVEFVEAFFTRTEKIVIAKRIAIAFMLVKGYQYHEIRSKIKVSTGSIANIADILKVNGNTIIQELNMIAKEDAFKEFLGTIDYNLSKILPPKGVNWSAWRSRIEREKDKSESPI